MSDRFLIFVPDGQSLPRIATRFHSVCRAMDELGRYARVHRITEGELVRDVTKDFEPSRRGIEPVDYEDEEIAERRHRIAQRASGVFGRR